MRQARKKNNSSNFRYSLTEAMRHRLHEGGLLILCAAAIFLLVSLFTYTQTDPGWTTMTTTHKVMNWGGRVGAWLSDVLFFLFGYVIYVLPFLMLFWGWRSFLQKKEEKHFFLPDRVVKSIGLMILLASGCGMMHTYFGHYGVAFPARAGGVVGYLVSKGLTRVFNPSGCLLLLFTGFLCSITLTTGFSWLAFARYSALFMVERLKAQWKKNAVVKKSRPVSQYVSQHLIESVPVILPSQKQKPKIVSPKITSPVVLKPGALPPLSLLNPPVPLEEKPFSHIRFEELSQLVEQRLLDFGVEVKVTAVHPGPVITRFELELAPGIKVSKITGLAKDIARSLSVASVRVVEVIPGKSVIGLEIANENREVVSLREILESSQYIEQSSPVSLALGKDVSGTPTIVDLAKMPHLLVAGTTGSGKSVSLNAMLLSMLYKATPTELRFILIDPKMLELSIYEGIPHLLTPVITDMKEASNAFRWCVVEMDKRYKLMASLGVRNLAGYNLKIQEAIKQGNPLSQPEWLLKPGEEAKPLESLPLIVVVADELADMMMVVGKKVEELVVRLAQKARAAGIHLILATQRPSVDVITGLIKANVPTRIAFQVSSRIDSRTILDQQGAEQLLGHGDMLYLPAGAGIPVRIHGAYVSDEEVHRVVAAWQTYGKPDYLNSVTEESEDEASGENPQGETDPLYDQAVRIVTESRRASISLIQRRLRIGYNRAARMMEEMENAGLVSSMDTGGGREVLVEPIN